MADRDVEDLLDEVLEHVEDGKVIPIIGDELLCVSQDGHEFQLYGYVARKLAERLDVLLDASAWESDLNAVACKYRQTGRRSAVYTKLKLILSEARFQPPQALLDLAGIDRFQLFVVLTFDDLLVKAINQVRASSETIVRSNSRIPPERGTICRSSQASPSSIISSGSYRRSRTSMSSPTRIHSNLLITCNEARFLFDYLTR